MSNQGVEFIYLQQEDCIKAGGYDMHESIKAIERSFFLHGKGDYILPAKVVLRWGDVATEETTGRIMSMPSFLGGKDYAEELAKIGVGAVNTSGIKYIPSKPHNPQKFNLPRANAIIIINDPDTLMPLCIMDGTLVSAMRTGAASGVAAKYLARDDSKVMGLIGASVQGITQAHAIKSSIPSIERCMVYDLNRSTSEKFVKRMSQELDMDFVIVENARDAFVESDVMITATVTNKSYVDGSWYKKGVFHCEVSFWDTPSEALTHMDVIVVDDWYQVSHHGADVTYRAEQEGIISEDQIKELGKIVTKDIQGRTSEDDKILFDPIGLGIHDLSEAFRVYENAKKKGIGVKLPLWNTPFL